MGLRGCLADTTGFQKAPVHLDHWFSLSPNLSLLEGLPGLLGSRHKGPSVLAWARLGPYSNTVKSLKIAWHWNITIAVYMRPAWKTE